MRSVKCHREVFQSIDSLINSALLPALTGRAFENTQPARSLLTLPARFGGVAIPVLSDIVAEEYSSSQSITQAIVDLIVSSCGRSSKRVCVESSSVLEENRAIAAVGHSRNLEKSVHVRRDRKFSEIAASLKSVVSEKQKYLINTASTKGVSSWLTIERQIQYGTVLNKSDFQDAVCLWYGFDFDGLPTSRVCDAPMTIDHALTCPCGG